MKQAQSKQHSIKLEVSIEDLQLILNSLGQLPYVNVVSLIHKIQDQAGRQLETLQKTTADKADAISNGIDA